MLFARNLHFKERNASGKCVLRYLVPKYIACNDVISSNWHYRDTNHTNYRDTGYFGQKLTGYGILRPPLMGPLYSILSHTQQYIIRTFSDFIFEFFNADINTWDCLTLMLSSILVFDFVFKTYLLQSFLFWSRFQIVITIFSCVLLHDVFDLMKVHVRCAR